MKNIIIQILAIIMYACCVDAQDTGIHFEHNSDWKTILKRAKAENKYIFVDCFTTWCGPCTYMSTNIFPLKEVGEFYNKNFLNLRLQFDTTQSDNEDVKNWYITASAMSNQFSIEAYPTFLFFDSNGKIVHKRVGSSSSGEWLITEGENAVNPKKQYYSLKQQYDAGKRDSAFLYNLIKIAESASGVCHFDAYTMC